MGGSVIMTAKGVMHFLVLVKLSVTAFQQAPPSAESPIDCDLALRWPEYGYFWMGALLLGLYWWCRIWPALIVLVVDGKFCYY